MCILTHTTQWKNEYNEKAIPITMSFICGPFGTGERSSEPETSLSYGLEFSHCYTFAPAISAMRDRLLCCRCCQFSLLVLFVCVCCVFEVALGYSTERLEKHMADDPRTITLDLRQRRQTGSTGDLDRVFPDPDVVSYWSITKLTD